jgi:UDP-N-acetylmuramate--alanine ligase
VNALPEAIAQNVRGGDVVICMGAGTIGGIPAKVAEQHKA